MSLVVFKDATLLDCTGSEPRYPATVVVEDNIIREVGGAGTSVPGGAEVVDCGGRTLMPGLIEGHMHLNLFQGDASEQTRRNLPSMIVIKCLQVMEDTLMQGYTSALDAGGVDAGFRDAQAQGLVKGPRMQVCGRALTQSGGHADLRLPTEINPPVQHYFAIGVVADGVDAVRRAAREELRMGADYVKIMAAGGCASPSDEPDSVQYSLEEMKAAVDAADSVGKICLAHCYSPRSMQRCAEAGVKRVEHGNFMDEETARILKKHGVIYCPTLATYDIMSRRGAEFGIPDYFLRKMKVANEKSLEALAIAVKAGLVIGSGSDMVGPGQPFKTNELELKSRVMGAMGAILSTTKVNSEIMRIDGRVGTVEAGKLADLLLLDENPVENIAVFQNRDKIRVIMQDGKYIKKTI
ncbi:MAG: amidohydrolase family protein [Synergistaceae bacterium]|jgi:imidazolonepropionase-like amidohydrolase|nr:amidohydrolase family protein [Synergistaceae bacterium]